MSTAFDRLLPGQYFPGNTVLHQMDPRSKILACVLCMVAVLAAPGVFLLFPAMALLVAALLARLSAGQLWRSMQLFWIFLLLTMLLQFFFTEGDVIYALGPLQISRQGVTLGVLMLGRVVLLVLCGVLLTFTTSPSRLTAGLESLLGPLSRLGLPVADIALMMTIAMRFVPLLLEETWQIMLAQQARGGGMAMRRPADRFKSALALLVPVLIGVLRRAEELALAMETRCFVPGSRRTHFYALKWRMSDMLLLLVSGAVLGAAVAGRWI
ncbi:MAG: energy-coupling factor transporter transmembrane component T family protein [Desulfurispora sp.]|uniref:energy-coupling factor transporter transmembrane component T family protein n=1 Tax=Desulfurispora sp. TaxID=3014275 RepID=UPI00404A0DA4